MQVTLKTIINNVIVNQKRGSRITVSNSYTIQGKNTPKGKSDFQVFHGIIDDRTRKVNSTFFSFLGADMNPNNP